MSVETSDPWSDIEESRCGLTDCFSADLIGETDRGGGEWRTGTTRFSPSTRDTVLWGVADAVFKARPPLSLGSTSERVCGCTRDVWLLFPAASTLGERVAARVVVPAVVFDASREFWVSGIAAASTFGPKLNCWASLARSSGLVGFSPPVSACMRPVASPGASIGFSSSTADLSGLELRLTPESLLVVDVCFFFFRLEVLRRGLLKHSSMTLNSALGIIRLVLGSYTSAWSDSSSSGRDGTCRVAVLLFGDGLLGVGEVTREPLGYEKFIDDPELVGRRSGSWRTESEVRIRADESVMAGPNHELRPSLMTSLPSFRGCVWGFVARRVFGRFGSSPDIGATRSGIAGTGGRPSTSLRGVVGRRGEFDRRDLSDMEPALGDLLNPCLPPRSPVADALRRMVRLVWTSATLVGVIGRDRRAAAAAADDKLEGDAWRIKAEAAAVVAFGFAVAAVRGCREALH